MIQADEVWPDRFFGPVLSYEDINALHEHITLSYLWVLGAYELVRTLCDRVSWDDPDKTPPESRDILLEVKNRFNRVRVPLSKHAHEDSPIAYPGMERGMGVVWILNPSTGVTRSELSDALLEALEKRRAAFLRYQAKQWREKPDSESPGMIDG